MIFSGHVSFVSLENRKLPIAPSSSVVTLLEKRVSNRAFVGQKKIQQIGFVYCHRAFVQWLNSMYLLKKGWFVGMFSDDFWRQEVILADASRQRQRLLFQMAYKGL